MQLGHKTRAGCTLSLGIFIFYSTLIPRYHCTYNENIALIILEQLFTTQAQETLSSAIITATRVPSNILLILAHKYMKCQ